MLFTGNVISLYSTIFNIVTFQFYENVLHFKFLNQSELFPLSFMYHMTLWIIKIILNYINKVMHVNINLLLYLTIKEFGSNKEQFNLLSNLYLIMQPFFCLTIYFLWC
jgi:hypothetical protein